MEIHSYPKIHTLGSRYVLDIFNHPVRIQTKADGSQFSFCKVNGQYFARTKGQQLVIDAPEKMFSKGVEVVKSLDLKENWIYRGEYLQKPKHNTLAYSRVPNNHILLYDIETAPNTFLNYEDLVKECERIGLEPIKQIFYGMVDNFEQFKAFLNEEDQLGGCKIEGLVIKSDNLFTVDGKAMMAKYVSEAFKEKHTKEWKKENPAPSDILQELILTYKSEARILKCIQHLKEAGNLTESPKDIGNLIKEYQKDLLEEEEQEIKQKLFEYYWPKISRAVIGGLPEFYKEWLAKNGFEKKY
jgi:hypothetical protein